MSRCSGAPVVSEPRHLCRSAAAIAGDRGIERSIRIRRRLERRERPRFGDDRHGQRKTCATLPIWAALRPKPAPVSLPTKALVRITQALDCERLIRTGDVDSAGFTTAHATAQRRRIGRTNLMLSNPDMLMLGVA